MILMAMPSMARSKKTVNVDSLSEKKRVEYLTKVAEKVVKRFGPGYYRKIRPLIIDRINITKQDSITPPTMKKKYMGRAYYRARFPYDKTYESTYKGYIAEVIIWADTGIAYAVMFGNGWGYHNIDQPRVYNNPKYKMRYERMPPLKKKGHDLREGTGETLESTKGKFTP